MKRRGCALLSAMPCDRIAATELFSDVKSGSFAEEWIRSQPRALTKTELVNSYIVVIPRVWNDVTRRLEGLNVMTIPNATSKDLAKAFETNEVIGLLAHHVEDLGVQVRGIEFMDRVVSHEELKLIAPKEVATIHLGVCRSAQLIEPLKAQYSHVMVIASQAQVDPEFFLLSFANTVQHWKNNGGDYIQRHVEVRTAMLKALGVT